MISSYAILSGTGCRMNVAQLWALPISDACGKFGIKSDLAVASFLANVGVESGSLTAFAESLSYTALRLAAVWPARYAVDPKAATPVPNSLALSLARKPQAIANNVYANRLGNGNEASGDGWRFRGMGPIQITGRTNYERCAKAIGIDIVSQPDLLTKPVAGALSAAWFFADSGCIAAAEAGDIRGVVKRINGAYPSDANQGPLREARRKAALIVLSSSAPK